ncbi:hypothetical protein NLG97_g11340 [Lecanicillium saksenae]|uniref:Uncharacterized protein n=1 Tax=Lecanicillium saksenae TaxID=468837 RepID=A0ACC1QD23_9HYPO|nr:hypothetical protein NLG97_g11340 [Lecanicillium saksenae]
MPDVQREIAQQKLRRGDESTFYIVTGLMIARKGGSVGAEVDASGAGNASIDMGYKNTEETFKSGHTEGDRVWAVRLAKVHNGRRCRRWMQTEEPEGYALDVDGEAEEDVAEVLRFEGVEDFDILECAAGGDRDETLSFVTMAPKA